MIIKITLTHQYFGNNVQKGELIEVNQINDGQLRYFPKSQSFQDFGIMNAVIKNATKNLHAQYAQQSKPQVITSSSSI